MARFHAVHHAVLESAPRPAAPRCLSRVAREERVPGVRDASRIPHHVQHVQLHTSPPRENFAPPTDVSTSQRSCAHPTGGPLGGTGLQVDRRTPRRAVQMACAARTAPTEQGHHDSVPTDREPAHVGKGVAGNAPSACHATRAPTGDTSQRCGRTSRSAWPDRHPRETEAHRPNRTQGAVPAHDRRPWCRFDPSPRCTPLVGARRRLLSTQL